MCVYVIDAFFFSTSNVDRIVVVTVKTVIILGVLVIIAVMVLVKVDSAAT